jgi:hypothetical protein
MRKNLPQHVERGWRAMSDLKGATPESWGCNTAPNGENSNE